MTKIGLDSTVVDYWGREGYPRADSAVLGHLWTCEVLTDIAPLWTGADFLPLTLTHAF